MARDKSNRRPILEGMSAAALIMTPAVANGAHAAVELPVKGGTALVPLPRDDKAELTPTDLSGSRVSGKPYPTRTTTRPYFEAADGRMITGVFDASPGSLEMKEYPYDEIDYVVSGELEIHDKSTGITHEFGPGDHFVTPKGFNGYWTSKSDVRVYYIIAPDTK